MLTIDDVLRVPFQQVLSLVGARQVYLQGGLAYVPLPHLISAVVAKVLCRGSTGYTGAITYN